MVRAAKRDVLCGAEKPVLSEKIDPIPPHQHMVTYFFINFLTGKDRINGWIDQVQERLQAVIFEGWSDYVVITHTIRRWKTRLYYCTYTYIHMYMHTARG